MRTTAASLPRRLIVGATSAALVGGALTVVPFLTPAAAAGCPTWTDPAGDASTAQLPNPTGLIGDDNLDLVGAALTTTATTVTATFKVVGLAETASDLGDELYLAFTAAGKELHVYTNRDVELPGLGKPVGDDAGFYNATDDTAAAGKATAKYDVASNTVTVTGNLADLATAAGVPLAGQAVTAIVAHTRNHLAPAGDGLPYDDAPTTLTATLGTACSASSPGPTTSPTATATPSPTPSATATASPTPSPTPTKGPDGLLTQPRKGCVSFTDPADDADPTGLGPLTEPSLDITQVNHKSPARQLQLFVKLADAEAELAPIWDGRTYEAAFTINGKRVVLSAPGDGPATATVAGAANSDVKATVKVDPAADNVVFSVPLDGLSKAVATPVKVGTVIRETAVATYAGSMLGAQPADDATGATTAQKSYTYGDNSCFLPPPGKVVLAIDRSGQFGDHTVFFATLNDANGTAVPGARLVASITGGRAIAARTDRDGVAKFTLPLTVLAGAKTVAVSFAGDDEVGRTTTVRPFTVMLERTFLRLARLPRGLQATLVDDDRPAHAVVGRTVVFTVGSKKYAVRTSSSGIARLTGIKKGTAIRVSFAGVRGQYAAAPTVTGRAG